jgi:hypothetical protein
MELRSRLLLGRTLHAGNPSGSRRNAHRTENRRLSYSQQNCFSGKFYYFYGEGLWMFDPQIVESMYQASFVVKNEIMLHAKILWMQYLSPLTRKLASSNKQMQLVR